MNIAIVSALFARNFGRLLGPYKGGLAAVIAITFYTILVAILTGESIVRHDMLYWDNCQGISPLAIIERKELRFR